jgi:hypothetical protein
MDGFLAFAALCLASALGGGRLRPDILDGLAYADLTAGGERNLIVLDTGDVLNDGFAVRSPGINAEGEVSSRCGHGIRDASSKARRMMTSRSVVILRPTE